MRAWDDVDRDSFVAERFYQSSRVRTDESIGASDGEYVRHDFFGFDHGSAQTHVQVLADVVIQIVFGDLALRAEPNVFEALSVPDAFLENSDNVGAAADVGMDKRIDEFR